MLSKTMQDAFSEQIRNEFSSAYLYLSMALYFEKQACPASPSGCASRSQKSRPTR